MNHGRSFVLGNNNLQTIKFGPNLSKWWLNFKSNYLKIESIVIMDVSFYQLKICVK